MKLAVISDIHLGAAQDVDEFGHEVDAFLAFLSDLELQFDRIILNGDVLEGLRGKRLGRATQRTEVFAAAARYADLVAYLQSPKFDWIAGNHDRAIAEAGVPLERKVCVDGCVLLFTHGDTFDRIEKLAPGLSALVNWTNAWVNRWTGRDADDGLYRLEAWLLGLREDPHADRFQRSAIRAARHAEANVIVVGHTHMGGVWAHANTVYANSGTCSLGRLEWLSIDTSAKTVSFCRDSTEQPPIQCVTWKAT